MAARGDCGGPFREGLPGASARREWCPFSAAVVTLPPAVTYEVILGASAPGQVLDGFSGPPDQVTGEREWVTASRCPLPGIDSGCPAPARHWIGDACAVSREVAAGLPSEWQTRNPSPALRDACVLLKAESEKADHHRATNEETW